jgi:hypothetical protein
MKSTRTALVAAIAVLEFGTARPAQTERALVQVLVLGPNGQPLTGLTRDDFRITVGGQPVVVESAEGGPSPASIVVLLDVSTSLDGSYGKGPASAELRAKIGDMMAATALAVDRWRFASFARTLRMTPGFASDPAVLRASIKEIFDVPDADRYGPSPAWDAADAGISVLEGERGRRSVLIVTDGRATGNSRGLTDVVRHAIAAGVPVSVVGPTGQESFRLSDSTALLVDSRRGIQRLATDTGGSYDAGFARFGGRQVPLLELTLPLEAIALQTRLSYLIGVALPSAGQWPLKIGVTRPGAIVRAPAWVEVR